jgi:hypothetical protein
MYCQNCGKEVSDQAVVCVNCGVQVGNGVIKRTVSSNDDTPTGGMKVLCFFLPLIGLILYLVWKNDFPIKSKAYGKFALIGFCVTLGFYFLIILIGACMASI